MNKTLIIKIYTILLFFVGCKSNSVYYLEQYRTDSLFEDGKIFKSKSRVNKPYYKELQFDGELLRSISIYNNDSLFDYTYETAIQEYEYSGDTLKFIKLYNRFKERAEDGFKGYWSIELSYDSLGRVKKKVFRNKDDELLTYYPNIDFYPPYFTYDYYDGYCIRKWLDNDKVIQYSDTCEFSQIMYKKSQFMKKYNLK